MHVETFLIAMLFLRLAFLLPALADFVLAGLTLFRSAGIADPSIVPRVQFAGVAFAWGVLLLVGLIRTVERAWILLPTMIAITGVLLGLVAGYTAGFVETETMVFSVLVGGIMVGCGWLGLRFAGSTKTPVNKQAS